MEMYNPAHPGEVLREYMGQSLTVSEFARHLGVTRVALSMILNGRAGISATMAVKLSEAFPQSDAQFWLNLQSQYDLAKVRRMKRKKVAPVKLAAAA